MSKEDRVRELIRLWIRSREDLEGSTRYCQLASDLYQVRNPGFNDSPPLSHWPPRLVDSDSEVMAAVEHYFLTRCWVGSGQYPTWQVRAMRDVYGLGKRLGVTPRHNPDNPATPPSELQRQFQDEGIRHGQSDLTMSGGEAPLMATPPRYW
jgi:hypothetical protein